MIHKNKLTLLFLCFSIFACAHKSSQPKPIEYDKKIVKLKLDGRERVYTVFTPLDCQSGKPCPLIFAFHGGGGHGEALDGIIHLSEKISAYHVIVVYPDGYNKSWNDGRPEVSAGIDDVRFVDRIAQDIQKAYHVDRARICATGLSNGGFFSFRLACERAQLFSSVAPVGAHMGTETFKNCKPASAISVFNIVGEKDPLVPFSGGYVTGPLGFKKRGAIVSSDDVLKFWGREEKCQSSGTSEQNQDQDDGTSVIKTNMQNCRSGTEVRRWEIIGGGHTWPGGKGYLPEILIGKTSHEFSASDEILKFCLEHPKQPPP